ncbi:hypothetical protein OAV71_03615 [Opitutales bacterium]|jgi:hypothetical protein|nr:hypothetical protein [Opitutales bacterium]
MEILLERILSNPLLSFALALLCILLLFAVLKGLIKLILIVLVVGAVYLGYVSFFQDEYPLPEIDEDVIEQWNEWTEPLRSIGFTIPDLNQSIRLETEPVEQE